MRKPSQIHLSVQTIDSFRTSIALHVGLICPPLVLILLHNKRHTVPRFFLNILGKPTPQWADLVVGTWFPSETLTPMPRHSEVLLVRHLWQGRLADEGRTIRPALLYGLARRSWFACVGGRVLAVLFDLRCRPGRRLRLALLYGLARESWFACIDGRALAVLSCLRCRLGRRLHDLLRMTG